MDYEYERAGTASIFIFTEPLAGWREVSVRQRRTKTDWATEIARLLEGRYADCEKIVLVCDQLNTHTKGACYKVFEPRRARQLVQRIEFCYTPKHGSWLNIAENELSSLTRQCIADERFGEIETLRDTAAAWSTDVNNTQRGVVELRSAKGVWQMKIDDARCKLISIYPKIKFTLKSSCDAALEHNFGHGKQYLASFLATLNITVAAVPHGAGIARLEVQLLRSYLPTRKTFFDDLRALFTPLLCTHKLTLE